jgi:hypothetical protein
MTLIRIFVTRGVTVCFYEDLDMMEVLKRLVNWRLDGVVRAKKRSSVGKVGVMRTSDIQIQKSLF